MCQYGTKSCGGITMSIITTSEKQAYDVWSRIVANNIHKTRKLTEKFVASFCGNNIIIAHSHQPHDIRTEYIKLELKTNQNNGSAMCNDTLPTISSEGKDVFYMYQTNTGETKKEKRSRLHKSELFIFRGCDITLQTHEQVKAIEKRAKQAYLNVIWGETGIKSEIITPRSDPRPNWSLSLNNIRQCHDSFISHMTQ